jgi:hypothetical protein
MAVDSDPGPCSGTKPGLAPHERASGERAGQGLGVSGWRSKSARHVPGTGILVDVGQFG